MPKRRHVVAVANGPRERVEAMCADLRRELPNHEHHLVADAQWLQLVERFPPFTVAHTAALIGPGTNRSAFRHALALAPTRMLAYDAHGERFHLHPKQIVASMLFLRGWPVHEIHLRPWRDDTIHYAERREMSGKAPREGVPSVAMLSPYLPWPLAHGGAVRIYSLLRETAAQANVHLFAFLEEGESGEAGPLAEFCTKITLVRKPKFQRLRWASLVPPEVLEYETPTMQTAWSAATADVKQVEFTQLAGYAGDILVEHDVTMDLARQEHARAGTWRSWWNAWRWRRYETAALGRFRAIVVMSERDRSQIQHRGVTVAPNGVDLERFRWQPNAEDPGSLLFIGSFRHFPNALAYRFLAEEVWPHLQQMRMTVVAGPKPESYYPFGPIPRPAGVTVCGFVSDVERLYAAAQVVLIPTPVSAGTNIKALEAMACGKAIVATPSGVHGLGLRDGEEVLIAESARDFAGAIQRLLGDAELRQRLGRAARQRAEAEYDWRAIAKRQVELWNHLSQEPGRR
jgi:glycosyltransferase involved in cell wall biosynthesis